jgi:hypothetical protein
VSPLDTETLAGWLVERQVLPRERLDRARARQRLYGGGLDTALLELGSTDEATLSRCLCEAAGLEPPRPEWLALDAAPVASDQALDAATARRLGAQPVAEDGDRVVVVARPGADVDGLYAWAAARNRGLRVHPVPEVRLEALWAAVHGTPLPARYASLLGRLADTLAAVRAMAARATARPLPRPPVETGPVAPRNPAPAAAAATLGPRPPVRAGVHGPAPAFAPTRFAPRPASVTPAAAPAAPATPATLATPPPAAAPPASAATTPPPAGAPTTPPPAAAPDWGLELGALAAGDLPAAPVPQPRGEEEITRRSANPLEQPESVDGLLDALDTAVPGSPEHATLLRRLRRFAADARVGRLLAGLRAQAAEGGLEAPQAIGALAELRDEGAVPLLIDLLADDEPVLRDGAFEALRTITRHDFGPTRWRWSRWWREAGERHRVQWLLDALEGKDPELRLHAAQELEQLSGRYVGYHFDLGKRDRDEARRRWQEWWDDLEAKKPP